MKQNLIKGMTVAGIAFLALPSFAQDKNVTKDKKEVQQIIITRSGNADEKTVIEINGDKVTVNGKDDAANDDVNVRISKIRDLNALRNGPPPGRRIVIGGENVMPDFLMEDSNRSMLGVVTEEDSKGAKINSVTKESAAEKAGLKKGDVITKVNDDKISSASDVTKAIRKHKPGEKVTVNYLRDGKEQKATAELSTWKGIDIRMSDRADMGFTIPRDLNITMPRIPRVPNVVGYGNGAPRLGLSIQETEDGKGVKVLDIDEDGNAAKAGLKEGDIITHVNDISVNTTDEATRLIRSARDKNSMSLKLLRNGKQQTIEVKVPRRLKTADL